VDCPPRTTVDTERLRIINTFCLGDDGPTRRYDLRNLWLAGSLILVAIST
jgi:hypothetical protein